MKNILILVVSLIIVSFLNMNSYGQDNHKSCCSDGNHSSCIEKKSSDHSSSTINDSNDVNDLTALVCPVSKEEIEEGEGVKFNYLGKEYTFCCPGCIEKFKSEPINYIDDELKCPVMGELVDSELFTEYNGVKYYFCCEGCVNTFNSDPEKYLENSDD
jgi:YHS domain-containing protein